MEHSDYYKSTYEKSGYLTDVSLHTTSLPDINSFIDDKTELFYEKDSKIIRSLYGFHNNKIFKRWLSNQVKIKEITKLLLGDKVYLHQSKINIKNNNEDAVWPFHRDFPFWNCFDNIDNNFMLNIAVFMDDVEEDSGALEMIPGSHLEFMHREAENKNITYTLNGSASSDLLFNFSEDEMNYFKNKYGSVKILGQKGTILVFNPDIVHGSGNSVHNNSRKIIILTFNRCDNVPLKKSVRPEYLCSVNYKPIEWN
jgi:ectoine hydroxylase